jgi:hypothetical protein
MSVGVLEDYKLIELRASHTWAGKKLKKKHLISPREVQQGFPQDSTSARMEAH